MRTTLLISLLLAAAFCGCKTTHIALTHPGLGVHVVAKFEAHDNQLANTQPADTATLLRR